MGIVGWKRKKEKRGEYRTNKHRISPQHEMLRLRRCPETGVVMLYMAGPFLLLDAHPARPPSPTVRTR